MDLEKIPWANYETEDGLEPEFEDVQVFLEELIAIDKFVWKF